MNTRLRFFELVAAFCVALVSASISNSGDVIGGEFYTTANIWFEMPERIYSTNYHRGTIIPVGTKIKILAISEEGIDFSDVKTQVAYKILNVKKHQRISMYEYFQKNFSTTNVMDSGGQFSKFSEMEQTNIKSGTISSGMSKAAVLMAYGLPPTHMTPSTEADQWTYWENRFVKRLVNFKDGVLLTTTTVP